jgi:hypothetical protein
MRGRVDSLKGRNQMRVIHFLCLGIGAALLTGCQQKAMVAPPSSAQICNASCDVVVSVTDTDPCIVSVGNRDIKVEGNDRVIRWKMDDASAEAKFRFAPQDGVKLKSPDPHGQFSGQGPQGGGKQFHWNDKNTVVHMYEYEVNVFKDNPHSGIKCKLDPRIWNS